VIIDQLICSPATIGTFFVTLAIIEKSSADEFLAGFKEKSWRLYLAEWVIWPPAQMINFYILPTKYRVLYDNTISLGYDVYTSYVYNEIPTPSPSSSTIKSSNNVPPAENSSTSTNQGTTVEATDIEEGL
jgi:protein Mpv17